MDIPIPEISDDALMAVGYMLTSRMVQAIETIKTARELYEAGYDHHDRDVVLDAFAAYMRDVQLFRDLTDLRMSRMVRNRP